MVADAEMRKVVNLSPAHARFAAWPCVGFDLAL